MKKLSTAEKKKYLRAADAIFTAVALLLGLQLVTFSIVSKINFIGGGLFLALTASRICDAFEKKGKKGYIFIKELSFAAAYVIGAVLFFVFGSRTFAVVINFEMFFAIILVNCALAVFSKPVKVGRTVINGVICILILFMMISVPFSEEIDLVLPILFAFIIVVKCLVHIIATAFANIKLGVLRSIIQKTYASEILFGLVMLVVSFSFVFVSLEPSVTNYSDAIWYCFAIITTIGFGDITVVSPFSRFLSIILGLYGIIVVALITSIIVNFYNEVKEEQREKEEKKEEKEIEEEIKEIKEEINK